MGRASAAATTRQGLRVRYARAGARVTLFVARGLILLSWMSGCSARIAVPAGMPEDAHHYSLVVDYQTFATDQAKRQVQLTPLDAEAEGRGQCRPSFRVTGQREELPSAPATEERGFWVSRRQARFDYRVTGPGATDIQLAGTLERTMTQLADERAEKVGGVTVQSGPVAYQEGHGRLTHDGEPVGEVKLEGSAFSALWADTRYVAATQGYGGRAVRRDDALVLYSKLDWGHWGVGERAFHVVADPALDCEELGRMVAVLLMSQLFAED
jgi:hypothetical protein